jgi:AcrR family transcriptional regulator
MEASRALRDENRDPVVDWELRRATIDVLRERGWAGLTLERVAEAAGRARSTLWRQGVTLELLVAALVGELADDFRSSLYPVLTSSGTGRERLARGLGALCDLLERHLPLMLATDEAFHQDVAAGQPPDYLHPFIQFLREGAHDGSLSPVEDAVAGADLAFNTVAWPYVHLRGRHGWPAKTAKARVVDLVLNGIAGPQPAGSKKTGAKRRGKE